MTLGDVERVRAGEPIAMRVMRFQTPGSIVDHVTKRGRVLSPWTGGSMGSIAVEWSDGTRQVLGEHNLKNVLPVRE